MIMKLCRHLDGGFDAVVPDSLHDLVARYGEAECVAALQAAIRETSAAWLKGRERKLDIKLSGREKRAALAEEYYNPDRGFRLRDADVVAYEAARLGTRISPKQQRDLGYLLLQNYARAGVGSREENPA